MSNRSRLMAAAGALALAAIAALIAYEAGRSAGMKKAGAAAAGALPAEVTASVRTAPAREGTLTKTITAYGSVVPAPGGLQSLSVPFECQIESVAASEGQAVAKGDLLLVVTGSPDAKLALAQARAEARAAEAAAKQARERHGLKLADDAALAQAEGAAAAAEARRDSLEARRLEERHEVRAGVGGVVTKVALSAGAVVPAGSPLAEIAQSGTVEVRLGVDPAQASRLAPGAAARIETVEGEAPPLEGRIRAVSPAVNPATRLAEVYVALSPGSRLSLGRYVKGLLTVDSAEGLVVPYASILPGAKDSVLFTLRDGRAVEHEVRVVMENGDEALVSAPGLSAGAPVVISGNYELQDGMAVKAEPRP